MRTNQTIAGTEIYMELIVVITEIYAASTLGREVRNFMKTDILKLQSEIIVHYGGQ